MLPPEELRTAFTPVWTDRLLLRAVAEGDADAVFAIHGNLETYRFHPREVARSRAESEAQPAGWLREWREVGFGFWAVAPEMTVIVRTRPGNRGARAVAEELGLVRAPDLDDQMLTYVSRWDAA